MQSMTSQLVPPPPHVPSFLTKFHRIGTAGFLALLMLCSSAAWAQTYPTFTAGGQLSNVISEGYAPSLDVFNNLLWMAYAGPNSNDLEIAYSNDNGATFTSPTDTGIHIGAQSSPSLTDFNNELVVAYTNLSNNQVYLTFSTNGSNWTTPQAATYTNGSWTVSNSGGWIRKKPEIVGIGSYLYLSFVTNYNNVDTTLIGWTDALSGVHFGNMTSFSSYAAKSDPSMAYYNGNLAIVYGSGDHNIPVVSLAHLVGSPQGFGVFSVVNSNAVEFANDNCAVVFNNALFLFGQSYYTSEDNLWATATTDGVHFEAQHEYGQVVGGGPGLAVIHGTLVEVARSKYNNNMWSYRATY